MAGTLFGRRAFKVAADVTAPTINTFTIPSDGASIVAAATENLIGTVGNGWTISASGGAVTVSSGSGSGTSELTLTPSRTFMEGETVTISYSESTGDLHDAASNDLASISNASVTNNSTQEEEEESDGDVVLDTSFEGSGSSDWGTPAEGDVGVTGNGGTFNSGLQTIAYAAPTGGGSRVLRQHWHSAVESGWSPEWYRYYFEDPIVEGEVFRIEFDLQYDAGFNYGGANPTLKLVRIWNNGQTLLACDWNSHHQNNNMAFQMVEIEDQEENWYEANTNGGSYTFPTNGAWVRLRMDYKRATEGQTKNGYVKTWVNGTLRFDYTNIWTCPTGGDISWFEFNGTFNNQNLATNNARYIDKLVVTRRIGE